MKQRLPFRLSAAGALSLVVTQAFYLPTAHAQANLSIDPNGQATPGSAVDSTLTIQQSGSTSPQSASTTAANVQDSIVSAIGGDFVNRANEVLASTTGNIAAAAQVVAAGEDSVATAIAQRARAPLIPMIKADAYGLGAIPVARVLEPLEPWDSTSLVVTADVRVGGLLRVDMGGGRHVAEGRWTELEPGRADHDRVRPARARARIQARDRELPARGAHTGRPRGGRAR